MKFNGLNKNETYGQISDADKRGKLRAGFEKMIMPQISQYVRIIFDCHLSEIF